MDKDTQPLQLFIKYTALPPGVSVMGWKRELRFDSAASLNAFLLHIGRSESLDEQDLRINGARNIQGVLSHARLTHAESLFSSSESVFRRQRRSIADVIQKLQSQSPNIEMRTQSQPGSFRIEYDTQYCFINLVSPEHGAERRLSIQFNSSLQSLHLTPLRLDDEEARWDVAPSNSTLGALLDASTEQLAARINAEFAVNNPPLVNRIG